ncbi:MAG: TlpA family protein disulfide reductase [Thermomicrobiales bacterium]|nr:TlpA family protein disulfide reductase [Thermomicrobiales bacterium]
MSADSPAASGPLQPADAVAEASPEPGNRLRQGVVGVAIALVIVAAAWFVGGRAGWDTIGRGGVNMTLLPKVGDVAPDFQTTDVFGNPVKLSDFAGRPVWLMFWGSWCPPCRAEFPDIQSAYSQLEPEGLVMLGVSLRESTLDAAAYAGQNHATFLVLSDPDESDTGAVYPIVNFPTHIFIDKDGVIRSIMLEDMDTAQALSEARKILDPAPNPA